VEWTWSRTKITCDYGPANQNFRGTISEIWVRSRPTRTKKKKESDQNLRGIISVILVRSRPPQTKITGVKPKSLVILVRRTKIPAEQYLSQQTALDQNNWSRTKITSDLGPADQNPRGTISEIMVRPDRNRPDQYSGDRNYKGQEVNMNTASRAFWRRLKY